MHYLSLKPEWHRAAYVRHSLLPYPLILATIVIVSGNWSAMRTHAM